MLVSFEELRPKFGVNYSRDHLRVKCKKGTFPQPVPVSERRIAWVASEVEGWVAARVAERDARLRAVEDKPRAHDDDHAE